MGTTTGDSETSTMLLLLCLFGALFGAYTGTTLPLGDNFEITNGQSSQDKAGGKITFGTHASFDVGDCRGRQAYSPENIVKRSNIPCCLQPNFRVNTIKQVIKQGGSERNGRRNFQKTRDVCCRLFEGQTRGLDALANIGCRYSDK